MEHWQRVVNTTIRDHLRDDEASVLRDRKGTALIQDRGGIVYNCPGESFDWRPRIRQGTFSPYTDATSSSFVRVNRHQTARLDYRAYRLCERMTKFEKLANRGKAKIIDFTNNLMEWAIDDVREQFNPELYVDGNATGNTERFHGAESFLGGSVANSSQPIADANDSYGGLSTVLQALGGTWSGNWPDGSGDSAYDAWSPLLVNYTSTVASASGGWSSSTKTWPNTCKEAVRYGILFTVKNRGKMGMLDVIFTTTAMYRQYLDSLDDKERIIIQRNGESSKLVKLGFTDVINQDGVDITSEYGVPADTAYGFNTKKMEIRSMLPQLFEPEGPEYRIESQSDLFAINMYGNFKFNPPSFVKFKNYG